MMRLMFAASLALAVAAVTPVSAATITFDEPTIGTTVDSFYNGGGGPNLGVDFQAGDWVVRGGFGQTSQPNFAFSQSGTGFFNIAGGFVGTLSFTYGAFQSTQVTIFDGLGGTGATLVSTNLASNDVNNFSLVSLSFAGTGQSFQVSGTGATFGFDDVTFDAPGGSVVPEPGIWLTMILGFGLAGGMLRYRRQPVKVALVG